MSTYINVELAHRWIEALRSGQYTKTRRILQDPDGGFCAIGVLGDLLVKDSHGLLKWDFGDVLDGNGGVLSSTGLMRRSSMQHLVDRNDLVCWNDDLRLSFEQIADKLQARLDSYIKQSE
jgi:hypothetical protein